MQAWKRWALIAGGGLVWAYTIVHYWHGAFHYQGYGDLFVLLDAVRQWLTTRQFTAEYVYLYPPLFYLVNAPLALLGNQAAAQIMVVTNQVLLVVCLGILALAVSPRPTPRLWWGVLLPLALNFRPLLLTLAMAKIEIVQLMLLLSVLVSFQQRWVWWVGAFMALAGMLKPLPLLLVLYFAWKREWRVVAAWALTITVVLVVCGVFVGFPSLVTYFSNLVLPRGVNAIYWYEDQSLMGVAARVFNVPEATKWHLSAKEISALSLPLGWTLRLLLLGGLGLLIRHRGSVSSQRILGEWSMAMVGMLLLSPFTRDYYAVFLMPAYVFLAQRLWSQGQGRSLAACLGMLSYLLVGQGVPLGVINHLPSIVPGVDNVHTYLHYGAPAVGYLLLMGAWALALRERGVMSPAAKPAVLPIGEYAAS